MRITLLDCDPEVVFGDGPACPPRLSGLAHALARAGHDVTVLCAATDSERIADARAPQGRVLRLPASEREIDWHFSHITPELVIERLVADAGAGARVAAEAGVLHLYDVDGAALSDGFAGSSAVRSALEPALEPAAAALAASPAVAARVRALHDSLLPIEVVPDAAADASFAEPVAEQVAQLARQFQLPSRGPCLVFAGPLERDCGLLALIAALARLGGKPRPRVLVIGDGPERNAALRAASAAGVGLVLCGDVPADERRALLALGALVVTPAEEHGAAPQGLLDAMAAGAALVLPDRAIVREIVRHEREAWLVPADDPDAYAAALAMLLADRARRGRLGAQARLAARRTHTWDVRAAQVLAFANRLGPRAEPLAERVPLPQARSLGA